MHYRPSLASHQLWIWLTIGQAPFCVFIDQDEHS